MTVREDRYRRLAQALALVSITVLATSCRALGHSFDRRVHTREEAFSKELISESREAPQPHGVSWKKDGSALRLSAQDSIRIDGRFRIRFHKFTDSVCAEHAWAGLYEGHQSIWGTGNRIWMWPLTLPEAIGSSVPPLTLAILILGIPWDIAVIAVEGMIFIPWAIAGHNPFDDCRYVGSSEYEGEGEREVTEARFEYQPPASREILVLRGSNRQIVSRLKLDEKGECRVEFRDIVRLIRGPSPVLNFVLADATDRESKPVYCQDLLEEAGGRRPDWLARPGGSPPDLEFKARVIGSRLYVHVENRGAGDAWQVAAIVNAPGHSFDGCIAAFGHLEAGGIDEKAIDLDGEEAAGTLEFNEAFDHQPAPLPIGK